MKKFYFSMIAAAAASLSLSAANPADISSAKAAEFTLTPSAATVHHSNTISERLLKANQADLPKVEAKTGASKITVGPGVGTGWTSIGTCQYTDDIIASCFNIENVTYDLVMEENDDTPGYYRLVNPYGAAFPYNEEGYYDTKLDHYIYIHAEDPTRVWISNSPTGCDWGYGEFIVSSYVEYFLNKGNTMDQLAEAGLCGKLEDGAITFPTDKLLVYMGTDGPYYANSNGKFRVLMPGGKDYSITVSAPACAADNKVPVTFEVGADVASIGIAVLKGDFGINDNNGQYLFDNAEAMGVAVVTPGTYSITLGAEGKYTVFALVIDANGAYKGVGGTNIFAYHTSNEGWTSLGTGSYTDDFLASLFNSVDPETMQVEIQEETENAGRYRVVNPYDNHSLVGANDHQAGHLHYLYIDATIPEMVFIEESPMGVNLAGNELIFHSQAYNKLLQEYTMEEIAEEGLFGTLNEETGVITFPEKALLTGMCGQSGLYYANSNGAFQVVLPDPSGVEAVVADSNAPVEYYNLQGVRVEKASNGLYIRRQGNQVSKVVIR